MSNLREQGSKLVINISPGALYREGGGRASPPSIKALWMSSPNSQQAVGVWGTKKSGNNSAGKT